MVLPNNFIQINSFIAKLPQQRIAQALSALLIIYIAFIAAKITWLLVPQKTVLSNGASVRQVAQQNSSGQSFNISAVQSLNLFGKYQAQKQEKTAVIEQVTDAPETRLQLTLSGLVASDKPETAAAIIEYQGKQATYGVGDIIKGTRANLERVLIDRVIIKQSGRLETLMLDGADYNQPAQSVLHKINKNNSGQKTAGTESPQHKSRELPQEPTNMSEPSVVDQRNNDDLSETVQELRDDLSDDPSKITDYLRISPVRIEGEIAGYRLSPGKNPDFFNLSGLKSGDIAVQMNGFDLLTPIEAAQAMSALKTERDISLLVQRQDDLIEILFSIE